MKGILIIIVFILWGYGVMDAENVCAAALLGIWLDTGE